MGALLHNGFVGWLLLAVGQRTPRAGRELKRRLGRGAVSSPAPTTAGAPRVCVAVSRLRVKRTSKDRLGEPAPRAVTPPAAPQSPREHKYPGGWVGKKEENSREHTRACSTA